jgi:heme/copper-type cytochrome/quinol oxidase subunit 2
MNKLLLRSYKKAEELRKKINKMYLAVMVTILTVIFNSAPVFAADFGSSIFATGTKKLATDIGKYLIILAPIIGGLLGVYFFIRRSAADEMDRKKWEDRIKVTVVSTLGAVLISALIILIASYYGKTVSTEID